MRTNGSTHRGLSNTEFRKGFTEKLPVKNAEADLVISNCVINLSPDKPAVFRAYRSEGACSDPGTTNAGRALDGAAASITVYARRPKVKK
jgi:hypothetical protein